MSNPCSSEPDSADALLAQVCRLHHTRAHTLLEEIGLYRGQPPVLFHLYEQDGLTPSDLVARLQVSPATVTKMVQRLERAGFVRRTPDSEDQRVTRIYLTEAGHAVQRAMHAALRRLEEETFAGFSVEEKALLFRLLNRARANLAHVLHEPDQPSAPHVETQTAHQPGV